MNLFLNGIFIVTCYPILLFVYFMLRKIHDKNGYCFGASLRRELKEDEAVKAIVAEYQNRLKKTTIVLAVLPVIAFFIPYISIAMTFWMVWILVVCFLPMVWMAKANRQVIDLKKERGWNEVSEIAYTELKSAVVPGRIKLAAFLPVLIAGTIPVLLAFVLFQEDGHGVYVWLVALFAACNYLFYGCAIWTDKQKITIICEDSDTNVNFARAKKQVWKNYWLVCSWINAIFTWLVLLFTWQRDWGMNALIWGSIVYGIAVIGVTVWLVDKLKKINDVYESKRTIMDASDDDSHWIYGMIYYNKNDKHIMVENRMSTGTALNVATAVGKGSYIATTIALLLIPAVCIWLILLEFTPIVTKVENDVIICQQLKVEYEIPLADIENYEVITELPNMIKVNGTGMDNLLAGRFEIYREGMLEAFLNPQNDLFIKIVTEDEMYYISGADDAATQEIVDVLEASQSY